MFIFICLPVIEGGTLTNLLDKREWLEELTILLDREIRGVKNWLDFAHKFGISRSECDSLKPKGNPSPTIALIKFIVQVDPDLTVKRFIEALKKIYRFDVVDALIESFPGNSH